MELVCTFGERSWTVCVEIIRIENDIREVIISGDWRRFHVIIGNHAYGGFICVPKLGISCELASFRDTFWNRESIGRHFDDYDTETLVGGISLLW